MSESTHKLNADQTVAVATDVFWNEDMTTCPRGTKCQLLGVGGVAHYGNYHGDPFWVAWAPLPKRREKPTSSTRSGCSLAAPLSACGKFQPRLVG